MDVVPGSLEDYLITVGSAIGCLIILLMLCGIEKR